MSDKPQLNPMLKLALDLGPLLLFFFANAKPALFEPWIAPLIPAAVATGERAGIFVATAVFMIAILASLAISYVLTRRLPMMAVVSAIIVVVFGGATLFFQNETFIKLKPTIIYLMFAGTLFGGLIFRKPLLAMVFDQMFHLTEEGWRKLTIRWALFFLGAGDPQRDRLAHAVDRHLGDVQGVRRDAADVHLRGAAIPAADETRRQPEGPGLAADALPNSITSTRRGRTILSRRLSLPHASAAVHCRSHGVSRKLKEPIGFPEQKAALEVALALLPEGARVVLMGDRFYGSPDLIAWCTKRGWDWRLRLKADLLVFEDGGESTLAECFARGERMLNGVELTAKRVATNIGMVHENGHPEPWFIAMSDVPTTAKTFDYGLRWGIEARWSSAGLRSRRQTRRSDYVQRPRRLCRCQAVAARTPANRPAE